MRIMALLLGVCSVLSAPGCAAQPAIAGSEGRGDGGFTLGAAARIMAASDDFPAKRDDPDMDTYVAHYALAMPGARRAWGFVDSGNGRLFVQSYSPSRPRGSVLFLHGYMDHGGTHARLYEFLLERGWSVYAMDLPGHGLSSGERMAVGDFSEYGEAARALLEAAIEDGADPKRLVGMGHSTGCAAWIECLELNGSGLRMLVFAGPLVRSAHWGASKAGLAIAGKGLRAFKRKNGPRGRRDSLPYPFDYDPLDPAEFPASWVESLIRWDERNTAYGPFDTPLVVMQGTDDSVLDRRYNLRYLEERFASEFKVAQIKGGSHYVFRYSGRAWEDAAAILDEALEGVLNAEEYPGREGNGRERREGAHGNEHGRSLGVAPGRLGEDGGVGRDRHGGDHDRNLDRER